MSSYFYAISGVIIVLALFENITPNSNTGKTVKTIISIICVMVILSPIINFLKCNVNDNTIESNATFDEYLASYQTNLVENSIKHLLITEGYELDNVLVKTSYNNGEQILNLISIKFKNLVISSDDEHINIIEKIKNLLSSRLNINGVEILIE